MNFIDEVNIVISSGHGGRGCVSFRRESMTPRGGPDGGDGGKGGDVVVQVSRNINSLVDYRRNKKYSARNGQDGSGANCTGHDGEDLILEVPQGTVIRNSQTDEVIVDMTGIEKQVVLKGGRGGKGNWFFKTSINQAPEYAQPGETGEEIEVKLELKLIADVGIIGLPNAGKSTLISRISAAKPKIADYPFTTLTPNLGVVKADYKSFVVADIPGLVKGAHEGVGLGIQFLRHIERTKVFIHLVDVSGMVSQNPLQDYEDINNELVMYDKNNKEKDGFFPLTEREQLVVLNKIDTIPVDQLERIQRQFKNKIGYTPIAISAVTGKNIQQLLFKISEIVFKDESANEPTESHGG